jgi:hypothetical protein
LKADHHPENGGACRASGRAEADPVSRAARCSRRAACYSAWLPNVWHT